MRFYFRPPRSPVGVSGGPIFGLLVGLIYVLLALAYVVFIWPFQLIWRALPESFPTSKSLPAWQLGLSAIYLGFLIILVVDGSGGVHGSGQESSYSPPAVATATNPASVAGGRPTAAARPTVRLSIMRRVSIIERSYSPSGTIRCAKAGNTITCHDHTAVGVDENRYRLQSDGVLLRNGSWTSGPGQGQGP
jgi:hypothetical protein